MAARSAARCARLPYGSWSQPTKAEPDAPPRVTELLADLDGKQVLHAQRAQREQPTINPSLKSRAAATYASVSDAPKH